MQAYTITDHVCRVCLGRVLRAVDHAHYRCADCGLTHAGHRISGICACGTLLKAGTSAGLQCQRNPDSPTLEVPVEIVVGFAVCPPKHPLAPRWRDSGGELLDGAM